MAYTDRYIQLPTTVIDKKEAEVMGEENAPQRDVTTRLNPMDISYYEESDSYLDKGNYNYTQVVLKSGDGFIVMLPVDEFEKRVNDFMK